MTQIPRFASAALLALDRVDEAIAAYEAALAREASLPNLRTRTYLDLPYLIATHAIHSLYYRALEILNAHQKELVFVADHFLWNAVHAFIAMDLGKPAIAKPYAERALEAAVRKDSGFRFHPSAGLVTTQYADAIKKLQACIRA